MSNNQVNSALIKATADDAIIAKQATVQAGYYQDNYLQPFAMQLTSRRQVQPIIKRGTHARVACMDHAISSFLQQCNDSINNDNNNNNMIPQIVVLGAGKDTGYFLQRDKQQQQQQQQQNLFKWYDIDHASVINNKATIINRYASTIYFPSKSATQNGSSVNLSKTIFGYQSGNNDNSTSNNNSNNNNTNQNSSHDNNYYLIEYDLCHDITQLINNTLVPHANFDCSAPTLLVVECVFMYIPREDSLAIVQAFTSIMTQTICICLYEPIVGTKSPFGQMMQQNLTRAGIIGSNSNLIQTPTLQAQMQNLQAAHFTTIIGCDMWSAYETIMTQSQRSHANQCELLDEIEEWMMIMKHYCFIVAGKGYDNDNGNMIVNKFCSIGPGSLLGFLEEKSQQIIIINDAESN